MSILNKIFKKSIVHTKTPEPTIVDKVKKVNEETSISDQNREVQETMTEYEIVEKEILPEKMVCPDCGGITLVGLDFCDKCGGELASYDNY